jgi:hypothetical protein
MSKPERTSRKRERFLQIAYDLSIDQPVPWISIEDVARGLGMDPDTARSAISEVMRIARYWGNKGYTKSQADGYRIFSLIPRGIDPAYVGGSALSSARKRSSDRLGF